MRFIFRPSGAVPLFAYTNAMLDWLEDQEIEFNYSSITDPETFEPQVALDIKHEEDAILFKIKFGEVLL